MRQCPCPMPVMLAVTTLLAAGVAGAATTAGKQAWTQARVSAGLHSLNQVATVIYQAAPASVPLGSVITQVAAQRDWAGRAIVQTSLCWGASGQCVDIVGTSINTAVFSGLDASQPMRLVHRVTEWRGSRPPLYVKGNVTVWYGPPEALPNQ